MSLDDIEQLRGSGQLAARYKHVDKWDFRLELVFKDGSGRTFRADKPYRSVAQLRHDWLHNQHKFYKYNFELIGA